VNTLVAALQTGDAQTEGQVGKLKLLKRQAFGRSSFNLLRRRVLLAAWSTLPAEEPERGWSPTRYGGV